MQTQNKMIAYNTDVAMEDVMTNEYSKAIKSIENIKKEIKIIRSKKPVDKTSINKLQQDIKSIQDIINVKKQEIVNLKKKITPLEKQIKQQENILRKQTEQKKI